MATDAGPSSSPALDKAHDPPAPALHAPDDVSQASQVAAEDREEADTCRICRGEGSDNEPLFYPCKCSGSIKYVHQECLMEWLSHTQKKHCELCKTSFRFTKLYHPEMPKRIPTTVFIGRAALHVLNMFVTWCRAVLVGAVWLFLLPWCMRVVWRSLFWVGDGGWARDMFLDSTDATGSPRLSPTDMDQVSSAADATIATIPTAQPLEKLLMSLYTANNSTAGEATLWTFTKRLFFGVPYPFAQLAQFAQSTQSTASDTNRTTHNSTLDHPGFRNPSLLSDIPFFNWFHSRTANRFIIDVLEGQIITLFVVVAFILIFLIREWVVQQQPVINMVALGDNVAAAHQAADQLQQNIQPVVPEEHEPEDVQDAQNGAADAPIDALVDAVVDIEERELPEPTIRRVRRSSSLRRRREEALQKLDSGDLPEDLLQTLQTGSSEDVSRILFELGFGESDSLRDSFKNALDAEIAKRPSGLDSSSLASGQPTPDAPQASGSSALGLPASSSSLPGHSNPGVDSTHVEPQHPRPNMPARDRSFIATEIRRSLEEGKGWSFNSVPAAPENNPEDDPEAWEDDDSEDRQPGPRHEPTSDQELDSEHSSGSWQQVPNIIVENESNQALEGGRPQNEGNRPQEKSRCPQEKGKRPQDKSGRPHGRARRPRAKGKAKAVDSSAEAVFNSFDSLSADSYSDTDSELEPEDASSCQAEYGSDPGELGPEPEEHTQPEENSQLEKTSQPEENSQSEENPQPEETPQPQESPQTEENLQLGVDGDAHAVQAAQAGPFQHPPNLFNRLLDWMFGDVAPAAPATEEAGNDEHVVRNLAEEAPFVPFVGIEPREHGNPLVQDPEVAAAAAQAGIDVNDQEAIEDAEDLEGILELIGMQGPIIGLFQNALFSAVLISATLTCAVWLPYLWGKVVILFMGNPVALVVKLPLQLIATTTDLIVDVTLFLVAGACYGVSQISSMIVKLCSWGKLSQSAEGPLRAVATSTQALAQSAMGRIAKLFIESPLLPHLDHFRLSINSHAALRSLQNSTSIAMNETSSFANFIIEEISADSPVKLTLRIVRRLPSLVRVTFATVYSQTNTLLSWIWASKSYKITFNLDLNSNTTAVYTAMDRWTAKDRMIAVLAGYGSFAVAGAAYLKRGAPFSSSQQGQKIERIVSDILQQAGGVLKVILIISIEMLAFPLYCGLLLDLAMLPLFKHATLYTRWQFARGSPWTSGFVHWFIGTCYMFHFALFVSMCRKIMRKGVLYFIRDPDDPTFHPVRDVLERNVTTQLRKIAFSALVYGALVIVCLGGVVWTLSRITSEVLPIHWTTEAPSLEFPLDLLFYNFLTPVIIKFYKPSEGLHIVYTLWFKQCASLLRLSNFLFGDKVKEQEGEDGKYVRAPASDQARVPKGQLVFVEVDENNIRKDGITEGGVHNTDLVQVVFIPPWFRLRIFCFVVTIWIFMGLSGVSATILPLLFGRFLFSLFLPPTVEMNDIHAFSLGVYTLGSLVYSAYHAYTFVSSLNRPVVDPMSTLHTIAATVSRIGLRVLRFTYVWASLIFAIPFLFAVLIELYFLMPLHAYLGPSEPHVVHLIQDWTLGFLYSRLAARLVFANRHARPARAFTAVVRDGYLYPNAQIATRCFLLPVMAMFLVAIAVPASLAFVTSKTLYWGANEATRNLVWRFSFPAVGLSLGAMWASTEVVRLLVRWRLIVRDEVYLIGERLHNFGEKKAPAQTETVEASEVVTETVVDEEVGTQMA